MKSKLAVLSASLVGLSVIPFAASAQISCSDPSIQPSTIQSIICVVSNILGVLLPVLIALGVILFVWGVVQFVISQDEEAKTRGRDKMIYGIIGLAVIIALWGIVRIVTNTFGLNTSATVAPPALPY